MLPHESKTCALKRRMEAPEPTKMTLPSFSGSLDRASRDSPGVTFTRRQAYGSKSFESVFSSCISFGWTKSLSRPRSISSRTPAATSC